MTGFEAFVVELLLKVGIPVGTGMYIASATSILAVGGGARRIAEIKAAEIEADMRRKARNRAVEIQGLQIGTIAPRRFIYGQMLVNGHLVFQETAGSESRDLYRMVYLGEGPINNADQLHFNEKVMTDFVGSLTSSGGTTASSSSEYYTYARVKVGLNGGANSTASGSHTAALIANTEWTNTCKMTGNAWMAYTLTHNNEVWSQGAPNIRVRVEGRKLYDPRLDGSGIGGGTGAHRYDTSSTWAYSNNSALCVLDFLINGMKVAAGDIDFASFRAMADRCDEDVVIQNEAGAATTQKRYTTNGVAFLNDEVIASLEQLLAPCHGTLVEEGGVIRLIVPKDASTVVVGITEDDIISEVNISINSEVASRINKVAGTFTDAGNNYQQGDFNPISSSALITSDGREHIQQIDLAFVTDQARAQRLASIVLKENALTNTMDIVLKPKFSYLKVGDVVTVSFEPEKLANVGTDSIVTTATEWTISSYDLTPEGAVKVSLEEYQDASYEWNTADHDYLTRTALADSFTEVVPPPTIGTPVKANYLDENGNEILAVDLPFTLGNHPNFAYTSFSLRKSGVRTSDNQVIPLDIHQNFQIGAAETSITFFGMSTQVAPHHASVYSSYKYFSLSKTHTENGKTSINVTTEITNYVSKNISTPSLVTSVSATGGLRQIGLKWTNPTSLNFNRAKVYKNASNNSSAAAFMGEVRGNSLIDTGLNNSESFYYWVSSVDSVENESAKVASGQATTLAEITNGQDGQDSTVAGPVGPSGGSTDIIFKRSGSVLTSAPTGTSNPPDSSWYTGTPSGTGLLYASSGTTTSGTSNWTWGVPFQIEGNAIAEFALYRKNSSAGTLTSVQYDFTTQQPTSLPPNWSINVPALTANGDIIYRVSGVAAGSHTDTLASTTITATPVIYAIRTDGGVGATGPAGPANLIVTLNGADVPIQQNPTLGSTTNANLNTAFVAANPLSDVDEIPESADIWCRFVLLDANGDVEAFSYRRWSYANQTWSSHGSDFDAPIFAPIVFSNESFTQHLAADVIRADNLFIDGDVSFEDGGAWSVNKSNYSDTVDGIWMGNPNGNEAFAFAASHNTGGANEHGVLFTETETKLINPIIRKGTSVTVSGTLSGSHTVPSDALSITITAVGAGGGGASARGYGNGTVGGNTSWTASIGNSTATGGAGGVGDGADKWRGDDGGSSSIGQGGSTNDSQNAHGNSARTPALGAGGSGGAGRVPDWNTSSRKGGAGGSAGQTTINTYDLSGTGAFSITGTSGTGGTGHNGSYGDGGNGGNGTIKYTYERDSSTYQTIVLESPLGAEQTWRNYLVNSATVSGMGLRFVGHTSGSTNYSFQNNTGRAIQVMLSISVSSSQHDGDVYAELSPNNSTWTRVIHLSDSDSNEQLTLIVPDTYYYRFPHDKNSSTITFGGVAYWSELRDDNL